MANILFLYTTGFVTSFILGGRFLLYRDTEKASVCFASAVVFLFAIMPMFASGNWMQVTGLGR